MGLGGTVKGQPYSGVMASRSDRGALVALLRDRPSGLTWRPRSVMWAAPSRSMPGWSLSSVGAISELQVSAVSGILFVVGGCADTFGVAVISVESMVVAPLVGALGSAAVSG